MPQTVAQLLEQSLRLVGEMGHDAAPDPESAAALFPAARDFLNSLAGHVTGTSDVMPEQAVAAATQLYGANVRLICTGSCTVTLPASPQDGWRVLVPLVAAGQTLTVARNGRLLDGAASNATVAAGATDEWFYRADLGDWRSPLVSALTDNVPWPDDFLRGLAAMLAVEVQPALGLPLKPATQMLAATEERRMIARYYRKAPALAAHLRYQQATA